MQRNPHSYQIATGYRTFYSLSLIYQPITKKRLFFTEKSFLADSHMHNFVYCRFRTFTFGVNCVGVGTIETSEIASL